jgi:pimeloyl-ACP methyl ester carboxylesterase
VVVVLAAVTVLRLVSPGAPQAGAWRSVQGREEYVDAYERVLQQLPEPAVTSDVRTRYGTVRAYQWSGGAGAGVPPVVLLPGRTSGAPMWRDNLPGLAGPHRIIALDPLGDAGMSEQSVPMTGMPDQAAWLDDVLDEIAPETAVHLVGHSFGGATAAAYALEHPDRVASLTLLEPVFTLAGPPLSIYLWSTIILLPTPQSWRDEALRRLGGVDDEPPAGRQEAEDPLVRMIDVGAREYSARLPRPQVLDAGRLAALTMPVYVGLGGKHSLAGGQAAADAARAHLPQATVEVWPGTSHSLPMQVPDALGRDLLAFWDSAEG